MITNYMVIDLFGVASIFYDTYAQYHPVLHANIVYDHFRLLLNHFHANFIEKYRGKENYTLPQCSIWIQNWDFQLVGFHGPAFDQVFYFPTQLEIKWARYQPILGAGMCLAEQYYFQMKHWKPEAAHQRKPNRKEIQEDFIEWLAAIPGESLLYHQLMSGNT